MKQPSQASRTGPDSGWSWVIAASCCFINMMMYGMCRLAGQLFVATFNAFPVSRQEASFPYSLSSTLRNSAGPLVGYLGHKFGVRLVTASGGFLGAVGIAFCYTAADVQWITVFWGIVFGLGFGLGNVLLPVSINQYFLKHRATASGISFSGACLGSFLLPPLVDALLSEYGLDGTFLILSGLVLNCVPAAMLLRNPPYSVDNYPTGQETVTVSCSDSMVSNCDRRPERPIVPGIQVTDFSTPGSDVPPLGHNPEASEGFDNEAYVMCSTDVSDTDETVNVNLPDFIPTRVDDCAVYNRIGEQKCHSVLRTQTQRTVEDEKELVVFERSIEPRSTVQPNPDACIENKLNAFSKAKKLCLSPMFILITISVALYGYTFLCVITVIVDFALDIGIDESKTKYILMCFSVGDFIGRLALAWTTDVGYMSMSTFTAMSFVLQGVSAAAISFTSSFWTLMVTVLVYGIFEAGLIVIFPLIVASYIETDLQTIAIASSNVLYGPICLAISPTIGFFREDLGSYDGVFYTVGLISLICAAAWLYVSLRSCCKENKS